MENNNIESLELEEMRQQMAELKKQLDQQLIVNEKKIKTSVKDKLESIKAQFYMTCLLDIAGLMLFGFLYIEYHFLSFGLIVFLGVCAVIDTVSNKIICNALPLRKLEKNDFSTSIKDLIKMKRRHNIYYMVMSPIFAGIIAWQILNVLNLCHSDHDAVMRVSITAIVAIICCIIVFTYFYRKETKKINYMIEMLSND